MPSDPGTVLLDTNLLLLWLAGRTDASLLRSFKRVSTFDVVDLGLLERTVAEFRSQITTVHVLTEVSNFVDHCPPYRRSELLRSYKEFIHSVEEVLVPARELTGLPGFDQLGLADTGIHAVSGRATVLTVDHALWTRINASGVTCLNFNHLRSARFNLGSRG